MTDNRQQSLLETNAPAGATRPDELTLRGEVKGIAWQAADGSWAVVRIQTLDGQDVSVIGDLGGVTAGECLRITGRWESHPRHGRQFRSVAVVPELPSTPAGIRRLLGSGFVEGIGSEMARRIVEQFGSATLDVIADHPERLREVDGIGPSRAQKIQESFRQRRAESESRAFLQAVGMGPALTQRVLKRFGDQTPTVVRTDPYRLAADVPGVGFKTADRIGEMLGIKGDDPRRAVGAVLHVMLEASEQGHVALPPVALHKAVEALKVPSERIEQAVKTIVAQRNAVLDRELLYPPPLWNAERSFAANLAGCIRASTRPIPPDVLTHPKVVGLMNGLHALQREAVLACVRSSVVVITGGPGTGKTTTVKAIVAVMLAAGLEIELSAPTGRAARRLSEATSHPARTLHRMLEFNPRLGKFQRNEDLPIEADVVLVDEASMLDIILAWRLVMALQRGTRLVLVGDVDQLPSVGPGTVLSDLIHTTAVPTVRLTEVFRQAQGSQIVLAAHSILRGQLPQPSPSRVRPRDNESATPPAGEFYLMSLNDNALAAERLVELVVRHIPRSFGLDPLREIQVLVPTHKGTMGAVALNAALQHELNPAARTLPPLEEGATRPPVLLPGDRVMQTRNDYDLDVFNGDIGTVLRVEGEKVVASMDGREVTFDGESRESLTHAYAITVHKSQGSEYDAVVIGLSTAHYVLLHRSLIYTAVTRAKRLAVIVGSEKALRTAVSDLRTVERFGALRERLRLACERLPGATIPSE